jgi:FAD/FMN-containing dehydrogenase
VGVDGPQRFRGIFRQDPETRAVYSESAGIFRIDPLAVAVPIDQDDLAALIEWAGPAGLTLIPRGSGSSMAGGATGPGVIVDLSRWKDIDLEGIPDGRMTVGPGAICAEVDATARAAELRFPVMPSSAGFCTIGGMTATNAAGAQSLAFGSMRQWVTGVECVFADGSRRWIRRGEVSEPGRMSAVASALAKPGLSKAFAEATHSGVRKESSGYATAQFAASGDLVDLLVGSEGTLAFFTRVELRLAPTAPATVAVMGTFGSLGAATDAAIRAREAGAVACELLDKTFLEFVAIASGHRMDSGTEAILLADVEGESADAARAGAAAVAGGFTRAGAIETRLAVGREEREALWSLRHAASPMLARLSTQLRSMQFIEDGAVPPHRLGEYVAGVRAALDRQQVRGVIFGHAGDAHVHVNPLIDVGTRNWRGKLEALLAEVTSLVATLGGTLSGEHGDGRLRTPLLDRVWSPRSLETFEVVKRAFDPARLLNAGVKTKPTSERSAIKYDPTLAPLPERAARALEQVDRARAYATFRLDLLNDVVAR